MFLARLLRRTLHHPFGDSVGFLLVEVSRSIDREFRLNRYGGFRRSGLLASLNVCAHLAVPSIRASTRSGGAHGAGGAPPPRAPRLLILIPGRSHVEVAVREGTGAVGDPLAGTVEGQEADH